MLVVINTVERKSRTEYTPKKMQIDVEKYSMVENYTSQSFNIHNSLKTKQKSNETYV